MTRRKEGRMKGRWVDKKEGWKDGRNEMEVGKQEGRMEGRRGRWVDRRKE